jgi:hypothetical protein
VADAESVMQVSGLHGLEVAAGQSFILT